jgi:DNA-binding GntR family transcriptional regulator
MLKLYEREARMEYFRLNQEIHLEIVRVTRNNALASIHTRLHARMKRIRFRGNDSPENWARAVADHEEIVQGLLRRDGASVGASLQRHLEASWVRLANSLRIDPESFAPVGEESEP